jgi:uncharacterized membrane protein
VACRQGQLDVQAALPRHAEKRRKSLENRVADQITRFAGSMQFVDIHAMHTARSHTSPNGT